MRFQVPQFIEVEDKIFGPLTFKQFIYLAGGAGAVIVLFFYLNNLLAFLLAIPVGSFALAMAFYKVNNKPFINLVEAFFKYSIGNKLYTWKKEPKKVIPNRTEERSAAEIYVPKLSQSKLKDLAWALDVKNEIPDTIPPENSTLKEERSV